ncbi:HNH endonuclease [Stenoxybacter acetivorans]
MTPSQHITWHRKSRANDGSDGLENLEIECRVCNLKNGRKD